VAEFVSSALLKSRAFPIQTQIIKIRVPPGQPRNRDDGVEAPKILIRVRIVIEYAGSGSHGLHGEGVNLPAGNSYDGLHAVETAADIRFFTN